MKKNEPSAPAVEVKPVATRATRPRRAVPIAETAKARHTNGVDGSSEDKDGDAHLREVLRALTAMKKGDFSARLPVHWLGASGKLADAFNEVAELMEESTADLNRINRLVGKEGKINERLTTGMVAGSWAQRVKAVNGLIDSLVHPISETARVIGAVATGDLSQTMALEMDGRPLEGEFLRTARTVNTMVDQLGRFASEVTRVAREVGTEGKLGGQAKVKGVGGTWKDLTDNVNLMASNLTSQVRNIASVTTAVANGDLTKKITVDVKGEILELKVTVNTMVDQLRSFASEVTRVAREVGTGRKARRPGRSERRLGHVERSHRLGEFDGVQPDCAGA
jgi:HAMP domain-containing protein